MGRRKIRHFGPEAYSLSPEESLFTSCLTKIEIQQRFGEPKPRLGKGSGRAGGARSSVHKTDHLGRFRVYPGTKVESCPICTWGMKIWNLWESTRRGYGEEWQLFWEGRDEERRHFENFAENYEADESIRRDALFWESDFLEEKEREQSSAGRSGRPKNNLEDVLL